MPGFLISLEKQNGFDRIPRLFPLITRRAWKEVEDMDQEQAKVNYIGLVDEILVTVSPFHSDISPYFSLHRMDLHPGKIIGFLKANRFMILKTRTVEKLLLSIYS